VGLIFAAFAQLSLVFYPDSAPGLVTNGDVLRLAFSITLLLAIEAEAQTTLRDLRGVNRMLGQLKDVEVERAALGERARLSRELMTAWRRTCGWPSSRPGDWRPCRTSGRKAHSSVQRS